MDSIPHGWKVIRFDDFTTLQRGRDLTKNQFKSGDIPVAGSNGVIGYHDESFVKSPGITVGRSGSCGKVNFYSMDFWAHNTSLYVRDFHGNDERFTSYLLGFLDLSRFRTGASVPTLDRNSFKELPLTVPEVDEQRRIAHVLTAVQTAIEQQARLIELTRELKSALMNKLFTEGLPRPNGSLKPVRSVETEIGLVPESWEVVKIGDVFYFSSGKTRPSDIEENPTIDKPFPVYGGNGVMGYADKYLLEEPALILGRVGEYCGVAHHTQGKAWISDNALYIKEIKREVNTKYMAEYFTFANLNRYSNKAGQPLITQGIISAVSMPLPKLDEQEEIYQYFDALNKKSELLQSKKEKLEELFRTLLHQLMTGQIRVKEADITGLGDL